MSEIDTSPVRGDAPRTVDDAFLADVSRDYERMSAQAIIAHALYQPWFDRPAVVSSFGAEAVVLLHLITRIKPDVPVIFIDTGKLFGETLRYRDRLQHVLGLEDVRTVGPRLAEVKEIDPMGLLNRQSPDRCCDLRKTSVLERALSLHGAWLNGRKRFQNDLRADIDIVARDEAGRIKLTPLANWSAKDIKEYILGENLPLHPLVKQGYPSIGCFPCTSKVAPGDDARAGRWQGRDKTECGIHGRGAAPKKSQ
ncbi:MAG: phosphoadenylyl-sulfate reductase [Pseudomonadota bacterium]